MSAPGAVFRGRPARAGDAVKLFAVPATVVARVESPNDLVQVEVETADGLVRLAVPADMVSVSNPEGPYPCACTRSPVLHTYDDRVTMCGPDGYVDGRTPDQIASEGPSCP